MKKKAKREMMKHADCWSSLAKKMILRTMKRELPLTTPQRKMETVVLENEEMRRVGRALKARRAVKRLLRRMKMTMRTRK